MGTYTLILENHNEFKKEIGSIGKVSFPIGYYTYTGSVPNDNFKRIERHENVCKGINDTEHWHIDYILHSNTIDIIDTFKINKDKECIINNSIKATEFNKIGASDCSECTSHLKYSENIDELKLNLKNIYK